MDVIVISLVRASARRAHVDRQLRAQSIPYRFFDAIDGKAGYRIGFDECDASQFILRTGRAVTAGEIGCFASHREVWRDCVAAGRPVVVLEDDFDLDPRFSLALEQAERLIEGHGFIRLQSETRAKSIRLQEAGRFAVHYYTKVPHGAAGYCISPEVARSFIEASRVLNAPVDVFIKRAWEHGRPIFGLLPYTVRLSALASRSTIGMRRKMRKPMSVRSARLIERARSAAQAAGFNRALLRRLRP